MRLALSSVSIRLRRAVLPLVCAGAAACAPAGYSGPTPEAGSTLVVRNESVFDAAVYVVRVDGGARVRVGSVASHSVARLAIRRSQLQLDNTLTLSIHPIGTTANWTSPTISLVGDHAPVLDIRSDMRGDCSQ